MGEDIPGGPLPKANFELDVYDLDLLVAALDYKLTDPDVCEDCAIGFSTMLSGFELALLHLEQEAETVNHVREHGEL